MSGLDVMISDIDFPEVREVDLKLIELARTLQGKIVTNDFNLNKVAQLRGVEVLNINELANALKPVVLPGEIMKVFILKEGKEYNQGVAYLDDGTMVVVDNARQMISKNIDIVVTSVLQTTAGKMIFGRYIEAGQVSQPALGQVAIPHRDPGRPASSRSSRRGGGGPSTNALLSDSAVSLVADGLLPDSRHHRLYDRSRRGSIVSSLVDRRGYFAHRCARAWSWLILKTTGVRVTVEGLERSMPARTYVFVSNHQSIYDTPVIFASLPLSAADHRQGVARAISGARLAPAGGAGISSSIASIPDRAGILETMARARGERAVAHRSTPKGRAASTARSRASRAEASCSRSRRAADCAAGGDRHAPRHAEGPAADRARAM